jgi:diacylglycerol kinase (ATP)
VSSPVLVIVNPASGGGGGEKLQPRVESRLRARHIPFRLVSTEAPGDAWRWAREARAEGVERILCVGGDGTVHEVVNGLLGDGEAARAGVSRPPLPDLAVLPVGTGNDFYRMVGAPSTLDGAMDMLQWGVATPFDAGYARWEGGERWFVNLLGVGIDVAVLRHRNGKGRLRGRTQYTAALLQALRTFSPPPLRILLEGGEVLEGRVTLAAITVGPSAGGGFLLNPGATPDDGLLDLCHVAPLTPAQAVRYLPQVIRGTHAKLPVVKLRRFRAARLEAPGAEPLAFELDGEVIPAPTPWIDVELRAAALRVLVPGHQAP